MDESVEDKRQKALKKQNQKSNRGKDGAVHDNGRKPGFES